ncbi:TRAP transporter substrate-binding protein [Burkholderiales bacterium]|jgi:TRAP-type mannitol/chloroaromatic compound transport system substrate-binding protein|nr:TRAP transporter substrate-binding protein [Burkholderiales bacterium]HAU83654.1 C4-dicarboxylate ABC transporter [Betaproteobacteria bacterium]
MRLDNWASHLIAVAAALILTGCGDSDGDSAQHSSGLADEKVQQKVKLNMASAFPASLELIGKNGVRFSDTIEEVSAGTLELKFFEPGALVPALEAIPAASKGSVDVAWSTSGFYAGNDLAFSFFTSVPFGASADELLAWLQYGGGNELADEMYAEHNIKAIPCFITPPEASGWFRKEINSVDDLKGMKMRFFGLGAKVMDKLGVATQLLAGGDIFQALQLGTIDATEFSVPTVDESSSFYQVAKHYYFPGWHQATALGGLFFNMDVWNSLSSYHQKIVEVSCGYIIKEMIAEGEATQAPAMRRMVEKHGVTIHYWSDEILNAYRTAWDEVVLEESAKNPKFKKIHDSYTKFREDYKLWGENGYLR